jgi:hypothetical protein
MRCRSIFATPRGNWLELFIDTPACGAAVMHSDGHEAVRCPDGPGPRPRRGRLRIQAGGGMRRDGPNGPLKALYLHRPITRVASVCQEPSGNGSAGRQARCR